MKVLNFGSLNIDFVYSVDHFVRSGETISSGNMEIFPGGKGLNQSVALAKSGVETWHAGAVGEDGEFLLELMRGAGVRVDLVSRLPGRTGHAIIQREPSGQNCILLFSGTNRQNTKARVDEVLDCFEKDDFLVLQNEINELPYIMEKAHGKGMRIVLNPSPMDEKIFRCPLEYVDYFLLNEVEAGDLGGRSGSDQELLSAVAQKFPRSRIVLTLGDKGSIYKDENQIIRQPACPVKVADTTAAGDTFTGFFIGGIMRGETPSEAMKNATKASAIAVSRPGAAVSIPSRNELI
ncbi:MAG: ribokinase [Lachnospiraceae bacterium]|nr:ribokinase [Lachnospiraceae bacterium]